MVEAAPPIAPDSRVLIEDFLIDYAHAIDDGDLKRWPDFFTADGVYQIIPRESFDAGLPMGIMYCEGRGMMSDRVLALETANIFEPHTYCHILGRPRLNRDADGAFKARTNFNVFRTMQDGGGEMFAVGKYVDTIALEDGRPMLRDRRVVLESRRIDILLVFPL
ncbi:MAG: aromatic-ring-hydroxylating dioxygenase subunit beta [Rhodospirillaceae bacterium]|jgi:anthranilate 1,2-dioxygenase small subunit|nr:aromatic-ring-hydroxylating dioxygenase subunit beta [Rhodospirillaceae bacterium]MBT6140084.1 aromatic-ring-hydroxylating dioxygenase subunit beta [Rhodospirillaceae bacterium]